jgi:hypothetical protein
MSSKSLDRVIFHSKNDGSSHHYLKSAERLLDGIDLSRTLELNDMLEIHHIQIYFDNEMFLPTWDDDIISRYKAITKDAGELLRKYLYAMTEADLTREIATVDFAYRTEFWERFSYFQIFKKFSKRFLKDVLEGNEQHITEVIQCKALVTYLNVELRELMLAIPSSAEWLLRNFEQHHDRGVSPYYFPQSLTDSDKDQLMNSYIQSNDANPNYLELIATATTIKLKPKTKLSAKKRAEDLNNEMLDSEDSWEMGVEVSFDPAQTEIAKFNYKGHVLQASYSKKHFDSLTTDIDLFKAFVEAFIYLDEQALITLVSKEYELDVLERTLMKSKTAYDTGIVFTRKFQLAFLQLAMFDRYLRFSQKGNIESLILTFIDQQINPRLNTSKIRFSLPTAGMSNLQKIRVLAPELEFLLKQYQSFVTDGEIDFELLEFSSGPIGYSDIGSLLHKKYLYSDTQVVTKLAFLFFSDQSPLNYVRSITKKYKSFYDLIVKEKIAFTDLSSYQKMVVEDLISDGYLKLDNSLGTVEITQRIKIFLIGSLFRNGTINYWHFSKTVRLVIDDMVNDGWLTYEDKLFTRKEMDYFNFFLNKKEFTNGSDLRNRYLHGTNTDSERSHEHDYNVYLILVILTLLKIDNDLTLKGISVNEQVNI